MTIEGGIAWMAHAKREVSRSARKTLLSIVCEIFTLDCESTMSPVRVRCAKQPSFGSCTGASLQLYSRKSIWIRFSHGQNCLAELCSAMNAMQSFRCAIPTGLLAHSSQAKP